MLAILFLVVLVLSSIFGFYEALRKIGSLKGKKRNHEPIIKQFEAHKTLPTDRGKHELKSGVMYYLHKASGHLKP